MKANHLKNDISIAVVDDHQLFRKGLIGLIQLLDTRFKIIFEASNGEELLEAIQNGLAPDLLLLDLNMPVMDGLETLRKLKEQYKDQKCVVLTMKDDESTLIQLLRAGVNGFLNKDVAPEELKKAILTVVQEGVYHSEYIAGKLVHSIQHTGSKAVRSHQLTKQELKFIELSCSEYTYKEIAEIMCLSSKTIDGYRAKIFEKLELKSRVGLVLYALKHHLISLP